MVLRKINAIKPGQIREIFFFGIVGVAATLTHYFVALGLNELAATSIYAANLGGYCSAVMLSYFGHSLLSFQAKMSITLFIKFCLVSVTTFLLAQGLLWLIEEFLALPERISLLIIVMTIPVISYLLNKFWVFSSSE